MRAKAFAWIAAARAKQPDVSYVRLGADEVTEANLAALAGTQGLFFTKTLALIDDPFSRKESAEMVLEQLEMLATSANPIALLAPNLLAARVKKIAAHTDKVFAFESAEKKPSRGFNTALVNALAEGNRTLLWKEVVKAERLGDAPEMIHGLLHWKARDLMQKGNKKGRVLSRDLIELLRDSRSGELPLSLALERFALTLSV